MTVSPAKEIILKKIRQALSHPTALPFPHSEGSHSVYKQPTEELEVLFAEEFNIIQGKFAYCASEAEMISQLHELIQQREWSKVFCKEKAWKNEFSTTINIATCDASVTTCECLIARTGSIVMSAAQESGRTTSVYAPVHICIAYTNQLVFDIKAGLQLIKEKYISQLPSLITFASGPSRTADIEKTLVTGVHGPKEVYVFLVESKLK